MVFKLKSSEFNKIYERINGHLELSSRTTTSSKM